VRRQWNGSRRWRRSVAGGYVIASGIYSPLRDRQVEQVRKQVNGFFYIVDRKSDMIIRGGENIYPREIDEVLYQHPAVAAAATIGVPDQLYGEEVAAFIVLKEGREATEEEIIAFCRARLADYKCPKTVRLVKDIPKGPTGKLLKRELVNKFAQSK